MLTTVQMHFEATEKPKFPPNSNIDEEEFEWKWRKKMMGNIQFISSLYLESMLLDKIILSCIETKLASVQHVMNSPSTPNESENETNTNENPTIGSSKEDDAIEIACKFIELCGERLQHREAEKLEDLFNKLRSLLTHLTSRIRFLVLGVIELKSNNWVPRHKVKTPTESREEERTPNQLRHKMRNSSLSNSLDTNRRSESSAVKKTSSLQEKSFPDQSKSFEYPDRSPKISRGDLRDANVMSPGIGRGKKTSATSINSIQRTTTAPIEITKKKSLTENLSSSPPIELFHSLPNSLSSKSNLVLSPPEE